MGSLSLAKPFGCQFTFRYAVHLGCQWLYTLEPPLVSLPCIWSFRFMTSVCRSSITTQGCFPYVRAHRLGSQADCMLFPLEKALIKTTRYLSNALPKALEMDGCLCTYSMRLPDCVRLQTALGCSRLWRMHNKTIFTKSELALIQLSVYPSLIF